MLHFLTTQLNNQGQPFFPFDFQLFTSSKKNIKQKKISVPSVVKKSAKPCVAPTATFRTPQRFASPNEAVGEEKCGGGQIATFIFSSKTNLPLCLHTQKGGATRGK
jgi:hypothetical protein